MADKPLPTNEQEQAQQYLTQLFGVNWRPTRDNGLSSVLSTQVQQNTNDIKKVTAVVAPKTTTGTTPTSSATPKPLLAVSATESPLITQGRTVSDVSVSFVRDTTDTNFSYVRIWFKGFEKNPNPTLMPAAQSPQSPITFACETTGETVTVIVQPVNAAGVGLDLSLCNVTTVVLDGVISAPPAPSIAQSLIGTAAGYQFSFNQVILSAGDEDVIDSYKIYRWPFNVSTSATVVHTFKHDPTNLGNPIVFNDTLIDMNAAFYWYWVTAVNTKGLESVKTAAGQTGSIYGSIGSMPAMTSTPFRVMAVTTGGATAITATTSPSCYFTRPDGTKTMIGQTSTTYTYASNLTANTLYMFPYWDDAGGTGLNFVNPSNVTLQNLTFAFDSGGTAYIETTTGATKTAPFTIEMWLWGETGGLLSYSAPQGTGTTTGVVVQAAVVGVFPSNEIQFSILNGSSVWKTVTTSGATLIDGAIHHVALVFDNVTAGGTISVWVDGNNTSDNVTFWQTTGVGTALDSTSGWWHFGYCAGIAGAPQTTNSFGQQSMARIAIYGKALDSAQIGAHFQAMTNFGMTMYDAEVAYDSAAHYWKLDETTGTVAHDSIGSNTGTYVGTWGLNNNFVVGVQQSVSGAQIAWPYPILNVLAFQSLRGHVPLSNAPIAVNVIGVSNGSVTSNGGGSSSGYSGKTGVNGGCFTARTLIKTDKGPKPICEVEAGDLVLTAKGTWRPVIARISHEAEPRVLHVMPDGSKVTYKHQILVDGVWIPAGEVYKETVECDEKVYTLSVSSSEPESTGHAPDTEHSFTLENGIIATNIMLFK